MLSSIPCRMACSCADTPRGASPSIWVWSSSSLFVARVDFLVVWVIWDSTVVIFLIKLEMTASSLPTLDFWSWASWANSLNRPLCTFQLTRWDSSSRIECCECPEWCCWIHSSSEPYWRVRSSLPAVFAGPCFVGSALRDSESLNSAQSPSPSFGCISWPAAHSAWSRWLHQLWGSRLPGSFGYLSAWDLNRLKKAIEHDSWA